MNGRSESVERFGEVIATHGGRARIRLEHASACGQCGSRGACAAAQAGAQVVDLAVPATTRIGDRVCVSSPAASFVIASLLGYLLPVAALLLGAVVAELSGGGDVATVGGALLGFCLALVGVRLLVRPVLGRRLTPSIAALGGPHHPQPGENT